MRRTRVQCSGAPSLLRWILSALVLLASLTGVAQAEDPVGNSPDPQIEIVEQVVDQEGVHTTMRIEVGKDAYLSSLQSNTNFGGASTLELGWINGVYNAARMLMEFNISQISANATVDSATLFIYQSATRPPNDSPMTFRAQYMRDGWVESGVVWNNANYLGGDALPLGDIQSNVGWQSFNVTNIVRVWQSGSRPNNGVIITGDETPSRNRSRQFFSKERPGFQPYVIVDFTVTCDTLPPQTQVATLPQFSPGEFPVTWGGVDVAPVNCAPTGISHFDVDFRIDGGGWQRWMNQTQATTNSFNDWAGNGALVEFRSRGVDGAGNVEAFNSPDTSTRVDTQPPVASMDPLPEFTITQVVQLSWRGTDNLSGIATYDVQWREDGGEWQWLVNETTSTSYTITGARSGVKYELRARATDRVGNSQEWSEDAQASTTVFTEPVGQVLPFQPPLISSTSTVTDSFVVQWAGFFAPGTSIVSYQIYFQFQNGAWQLWRTVPGNVTSDVFTYLQMGLGDGLYGFEAVATNNLGVQGERSSVPEATMLVDLADALQQRAWLPEFGNIVLTR